MGYPKSPHWSQTKQPNKPQNKNKKPNQPETNQTKSTPNKSPNQTKTTLQTQTQQPPTTTLSATCPTCLTCSLGNWLVAPPTNSCSVLPRSLSFGSSVLFGFPQGRSGILRLRAGVFWKWSGWQNPRKERCFWSFGGENRSQKQPRGEKHGKTLLNVWNVWLRPKFVRRTGLRCAASETSQRKLKKLRDEAKHLVRWATALGGFLCWLLSTKDLEKGDITFVFLKETE